MMKYLTSIAIVLLFWSCDSEKGLNCFQAAGDIIQEEFEVTTFDKITVFERIQLIIKDGPTPKVVIETGTNLLNEIEVTTSLDSTLVIRNMNGCNLVRDYEITKVYVTSPNIKQIRNSSGESVISDGTLSYPQLTLVSEDQNNEDEFHIDGDFIIDMDVDRLDVLTSGVSNLYLSGTADEAKLFIADGDTRVEARELEVLELDIFHRSSQPMIVNPIQAIRGDIRGIGDVISINRPVIIEVEEFYRGRLIFE